MNTGLGLSFLRIVNEDGSNGWAQVYARIPFDDVELKNKGALFGVVFDENKEDWAERDSDLMTWVEEYFNNLEKGGDLNDFYNKWKGKFPGLSGSWTWVVLGEDGKRELKLVLQGKVGATIIRDGRPFDFSKALEEGKILTGKVLEGDRLAIWTEELIDQVTNISETKGEEATEWSKKLMEKKIAGAGLILNFEAFTEELIEKETENPYEMPVPVAKAEKIVAEPEIISRRVVESDMGVVDDKYVGPLGFKEKAANWWSSVRNRRGAPQRKRWAVLIGVIFLILLVLSLVSGSIKMRREAELQEWQEFSEPLEKSLQDAESLATLNPSGAKKIVEEVRKTFDVRKGEFVDGKYSSNLSELEEKINSAWTVTSGEKESEIEEVLRIDLVRQGFKGDRMSLITNDKIVVLDSITGVVVTAEREAKDIRVIAGKGEGLGWQDVVSDGVKALVLSASGIRNAVDGSDLVVFDAAVAKPIVVEKFGSNLYVLDQGNAEIYRYAAVTEGYSDRQRWLKTEEMIGIEPVDMAIDSDIWLVSQSGQVERFRRGAEERFAINGLPEGIKISRIAVEIDGERIALLDASNGLVALCSKETGQCSEILKSSRLMEVTDIEFDEEGNLLVLLPGIVGIIK